MLLEQEKEYQFLVKYLSERGLNIIEDKDDKCYYVSKEKTLEDIFQYTYHRKTWLIKVKRFETLKEYIMSGKLIQYLENQTIIDTNLKTIQNIKCTLSINDYITNDKKRFTKECKAVIKTLKNNNEFLKYKQDELLNTH